MGTLKNKELTLPVGKAPTLGFLAASTLFAAFALASSDSATAGAFVFAGSANGEDIITHPRGYNGAGGKLDVKVCIVPNTPNTSDMEQPVKNAIAYWNKRQPTTSNIRKLPGGTNEVDFESIFVHELGHCVGLAHPNLANESKLTGIDQNYTKSTKGDDYHQYDISPGEDGIIGSGDDLRGNDKNLHWFRLDNNNPFSIASVIDTGTYARDKLLLPNGDFFAANGDRDVSKLYNAPNSEAIMQQGALSGEIQRTLLHDDVATLQLAMSGKDETANTSDDYSLNLVYGGISSDEDCKINVHLANQAGLAFCKTQAPIPSDKHILPTLTNISFGQDYNWHFNKYPQCSQTTELVADEWRMISMPCQLGISTPNTVEAVFVGDLIFGDYGTRWVLYEYLPASGYRKLELTDPLKEGKGYWIISLDDKRVDVLGEYPSTIDYPLGDGSSDGKWNLAGTPFRFDTTWADVQVIDTDGSVVTLDNATDLIHDTAWRWNGSTGSYETLTRTLGNLSAFDGVWVYSKKAGTALRVPMTEAERTSSQ